MGKKSGYGLLITAVTAMFAILILSGRPQPPQAPLEPTSAFYPLFPFITELAQVHVIGLGIRNESLAIGIAEDEAGRWFSLDDATMTLNPDQANEARFALASLIGIQKFERGTTPLEDFGFLPQPQYVVRFEMTDATIVDLYVGDQTLDGSAYYVSLTPEPDIIDLVPANWIDNFVMLMKTIEPAAAQVEATATAPAR